MPPGETKAAKRQQWSRATSAAHRQRLSLAKNLSATPAKPKEDPEKVAARAKRYAITNPIANPIATPHPTPNHAPNPIGTV